MLDWQAILMQVNQLYWLLYILLIQLTRATPKIASYPFTTLHPYTGKIKFENENYLTIADLPGLIEDAHQNKGLGHKFLKHIERTKVIIFVLDGCLNPNEQRSPLNDLKSLLKEISLFNKDYADKPFIIALNKSDLNSENFNINYELLKKNFKQDIIKISGKEGIGLDNLTLKIKQLADQMKITKLL